MVTPVTQPERLKKLRRDAGVRVYAVTMTGTTGRTAPGPGEVTHTWTRDRRVQTTGARIRSHQQAEQPAVTAGVMSARRWSRY
jgi:tryptophan synthase alpha subunit